MNAKLKSPTFWETFRKWVMALMLAACTGAMGWATVKMTAFADRYIHHADNQDLNVDSVKEQNKQTLRLLTDFLKNDAYEKRNIHEELASHKQAIDFNASQIETISGTVHSINETIYQLQRKAGTN